MAFNSSIRSFITPPLSPFLRINKEQLWSSWPDPAFLRALSPTASSSGAAHTPSRAYLVAVLPKGGHTSGVCMECESCHTASISKAGSADSLIAGLWHLNIRSHSSERTANPSQMGERKAETRGGVCKKNVFKRLLSVYKKEVSTHTHTRTHTHTQYGLLGEIPNDKSHNCTTSQDATATV